VIDVQAEIAAAADLIELQKQDAILGVIRAWLGSADAIPDKNALHTFEPEVQQLWAQRQSLEITRGILYRRYIRPDGSLLYLQIVVPQALHTAFWMPFTREQLVDILGLSIRVRDCKR